MGPQSGNLVKPKSTRPPSESRKIRKPLMERKRRERINTSLNDLAALLTEANMVKGEAGKPSKLEKADILELTVKHLKKLKEKKGIGNACKAGTSDEYPKESGTVATCTQDDTSNDGECPVLREVNAESSHLSGEDGHDGQPPNSGEKREGAKCHTCDGSYFDPNENNSNKSENKSVEKSNVTLQEAKSSSFTASQSLSKVKDNRENYLLGFQRCISAIDSAMKVQHQDQHQENLRPKLVKHLQDFLKSMDVDVKPPSPVLQESLSSSTSSSPPPNVIPSNSKLVSCKVTDVSSTTNGGESPDQLQMSSLTLVPTRLPGGNLAFVVQGGVDTTLLLKSAEALLQDTQIDPTIKDSSFDKKKSTAELSEPEVKPNPSDDTNSVKVDVRAVKVEGFSSTQDQKISVAIPPAADSLNLLDPEKSKPKTQVSKMIMTASVSNSSTTNIAPKPPPKLSPKPPELLSENTDHPHQDESSTLKTTVILPKFSSPVTTPTTSRVRSSSNSAIHFPPSSTVLTPLTPVDMNIHHHLPLTPTPSPHRKELPAFPSTLSTRVIQNVQRDAKITITPLRQITKIQYLPLTPTTPTTRVYGHQQESPSTSCTPVPTFVKFNATPSASSQNIFATPPKPLTPPATPRHQDTLPKISEEIADGQSGSSLPPPVPLMVPPLGIGSSSFPQQKYSFHVLHNKTDDGIEVSHKEGAEEERQNDEDNNVVIAEARRNNDQDNDLPFDLSLRRMWRPW